ncbi:two-component system response regulator PhoP [Nitrosomonas nitrosa]|uniref:DNA-binding response regulator in two-component regulatory system with PhoQ n=1 Tax=Nitrosomonas nitrosa TaxID=52442 RepID=A0A1I4UBB0_9PROT|nr:response regulator transcription factor [Nitrosomonas nitrosa]MCO6435035.1 response regulator transcription factor [Nitrosomonas nitrosa]PTR04511.1 two-component system response regulator PhoP [Nitrosomonas nitrosa]CAE6493926.1 DNA-binding response regulator in two-component regulatory system with PhoQ [Nitrosomonas nitrosa]SFM86267.1 two-component system, OmpR family, response regulator PhoP [Nitrosomonas nitrosa]HNP52770.1 response regulator transcription factor [Nitrosomonas nitrosa]
MRILIIEDEIKLQKQIRQQLEADGYMVDTSDNGEEGLYFASEYPLDAAIVDIGLPGMSGLEVIAALRKRGSLLPILILTARNSWQDKVKGLEMGADDYLAKPFQMEELQARLRALLRRASAVPNTLLQAGPITLDMAEQTVKINEQAVELTTFEYRLLELLMRHHGEVISKQTLTDYLYPHDDNHDSNVLEVMIGRLRRKLDPDGKLNPIETLRGRGYRFAIKTSS